MSGLIVELVFEKYRPVKSFGNHALIIIKSEFVLSHPLSN